MGWLTGWKYRLPLVIDNAYVSADLTDFPVLIHLNTSSGISNRNLTKIFTELGANSLKIAVTTSNGTTECYVEVEYWNNGGNEAWLWAKIPTVTTATDTTVYFYYDASHADNTTYIGAVSSTVAQSVWDSNFMMVHHLEGADRASLDDSTANNIDMSAEVGTPEYNSTGKIGRAVGLERTSEVEYIAVPDSDLLDGFSQASWEIWFNAESMIASESTDWRMLIAKTSNSGTDRCWSLGFYGGGTGMPLNFRINMSVNGSSAYAAYYNWTPNTAQWYHVQFQWYADGSYPGRYRLYIDGVDTTFTYPDFPPSALWTNTGIGCRIGGHATSGRTWDGLLDEVRVSNSERSAAYAVANYNSQIDNLITFGASEMQPILTEIATFTDTEYNNTSKLLRDVADVADLAISAIYTAGEGATEYVQNMTLETLHLTDSEYNKTLRTIKDIMGLVSPDTSNKLRLMFEEGAGLIARDMSGNSYVGTLSGTTWSASGKNGNCVSFDGNDVITFTETFDYPTVTVSVWLKGNGSTGTDRRIICTGSGNTNKWILTTEEAGYGLMTAVSTSHACPRTNAVINDNAWHHIVGVSNPESIYMDGVLQSSTHTDSHSQEAGGLKIGTRGTTYYFIGLMDDIIIFNRALSAYEIAQLYAQGETKYLTEVTTWKRTATELVTLGNLLLQDSDRIRTMVEQLHVTDVVTPVANIIEEGEAFVQTLLEKMGLVSPDTSCILRLDFDEGYGVTNGTIIKDTSGYQHNGTIETTGAPTWVTGVKGYALLFDKDTRINLGNVTDSSKMSWAFWYKGPTFTEYQDIIFNNIWGSSGSWWILRSPSSNNMYWEYYNGATQDGMSFADVFSGSDSTFIHIAVTADFDSGLVTVYKNGAYHNSGNMNTPSAPSGETNWTIGRDEGTYPMPNVTIDEVYAYNRILSASEVASIYTQGEIRYLDTTTSWSRIRTETITLGNLILHDSDRIRTMTEQLHLTDTKSLLRSYSLQMLEYLQLDNGTESYDFVEGFENGEGAWDIFSDSVIQTSIKRNGTSAVVMNCTDEENVGWIQKTISESEIYTRFWIYIPSGISCEYGFFYIPSVMYASFWEGGSGNCYLRVTDGVAQSWDAIVLDNGMTYDTWHCIQIHAKVTGTLRSDVEVRFDGSLAHDLSNLEHYTGHPTYTGMAFSGITRANASIYFDDIAWDNTSYIGMDIVRLTKGITKLIKDVASLTDSIIRTRTVARSIYETMYLNDTTISNIYKALYDKIGLVAPDTSSVLRLDFDENFGNKVIDKSGYNNNGTIMGVPVWTTGKNGKAVTFNGSSNYIEVPDSTSLDLTNVTLMFWMKPNRINVSWQGLIHKYIGTSNNNTIYLELNLQNLNNYNTIATTTNPINTIGIWYHVAYSGTSAGVERIYVNGVMLKEEATAFLGTVNAYPLYIGAANPTAEWFQGDMDDIRVYNRELSPSEIEDVYLQGETKYLKIDTTLGPLDEILTLSDSVMSGISRTLSDILHISDLAVDLSIGAGYEEYAEIITETLLLSDNTINDIIKIVRDKISMVSPDTSNVLRLDFDEGRGLIAKDTSGYGNDGIVYAYWSSGKYGNGVLFEPEDTTRVAILSPNFTPTYITMAAWVYTTRLDTTQTIIRRISWSPTTGYILRIVNDRVNLQIWDSDTMTGNVTSAGDVLLTDTWYHVVGVCDGTNAIIYINGEYNNQGSCASIGTPTGELAVGSNPEGGEYFQGIIDNVLIFTRGLNAWEINDIYEQGEIRYLTREVDWLRIKTESINLGNLLLLDSDRIRTMTEQLHLSDTNTILRTVYRILTDVIHLSSNLIKYSEDFSNDVWSGYCGVKDNVTYNNLAPDGTLTAAKWVLTAGTPCDAIHLSSWGVLQVASPAISLDTYTVSVWLKGEVGGEQVILGLSDYHQDIKTITTDWVRYTYTVLNTHAGERGLQFFGITANATYYAWGAQLEKEYTMGTYSKTTDNINIGDDDVNKFVIKPIFNTITLTDIVRRIGSLLEIRTETMTLLDNEINYPRRTINNIISLTGTMIKDLDSRRILSEIVHLTDSRTKLIGRIIANTLTLIESEISGISRIKSEILHLTDNEINSISRIKSESLHLTDTKIRYIGRIISNTLTLSDNEVSGINRIKSEVLHLTDTKPQVVTWRRIRTESITLGNLLLLDSDRIRTMTEQLHLTDTKTTIKSWYRVKTEIVSLTDTRTKYVGKVIRNTLTLSDIKLRTINRLKTELVTLSDTKQRMISRPITEVLILTDIYNRLRIIIRIYSEILNVEDTLIYLKGTILDLLENINLTDSYSRISTLKRITLETLTLVDSIIKRRTILRRLTETATLTDSTIFNISKYINNTINLTSNMTKDWDAKKSLLDNVTLNSNVTRLESLRKLISNTIILSDSVIQASNKNIINTITLLDTRTKIFAVKRIISDTITLGNLLLLDSDRVRTMVEQLHLTDTKLINRGIVYRSYLETLHLTATLYKDFDIKRQLSETATLTATLVRKITSYNAELLTLVDNEINGVNNVITQALSLTDNEINGMSRIRSESLHLIDNEINFTRRTINNTLTLIDNEINGITNVITQLLSLTDNEINNINRIKSEILHLTDNEINYTTKLINNTLTLSGTIFKDVSWIKTIIDVLHLTDTKLKDVSWIRIRTETLHLTDTFRKTNSSLHRILSDTIVLGNLLLTDSDRMRTMVEQLHLTATLTRLETFHRIISNTITLSDVEINRMTKIVSSSLILSDSEINYTRKMIYDTIALIDRIIKEHETIRRLTETMILSDVEINYAGKMIKDIITLIDVTSHIINFDLIISDIIILSDIISKNMGGKILTENIVLNSLEYSEDRKMLIDSLLLIGNVESATVYKYIESIISLELINRRIILDLFSYGTDLGLMNRGIKIDSVRNAKIIELLKKRIIVESDTQ